MICDEATARTYVGTWADALAMDRLDRLLASLAQENVRQNLVAAASLPVAWQRHVADSAQLLAHVPRETKALPEAEPRAHGAGPWIDLGTGAGFPGLVLAILRPQDEFVLVESRRKRIEWLERSVADLGLTNCRIEGKRVELVETVPAGFITARAFAPLRPLLELSARFSTERTLYLLPKGRSAPQELATMPKWIRRTFHVEHSVTDPDAGIVVGRLSKEARARL